MEAILKFIRSYDECTKFLPDEKEIRKVPKQWLINMIYTLIRDPFSEWVKSLIDARNKKVTVAHNLLIDMDPEVAAAFANSTAVSSK